MFVETERESREEEEGGGRRLRKGFVGGEVLGCIELFGCRVIVCGGV